jgi:predicted HNH restriction endonuclease
MERDGWNCTKCSSIERLDAHHIKPISIIIKELTEGISFERDLDKYNFLKDNEFILDTDLKNGICLCRKCHKEVHKNWGSHKPEY